ncbi:hypothetical protein, partial [Mycoplasma sp. CB776]
MSEIIRISTVNATNAVKTLRGLKQDGQTYTTWSDRLTNAGSNQNLLDSTALEADRKFADVSLVVEDQINALADSAFKTQITSEWQDWKRNSSLDANRETERTVTKIYEFRDKIEAENQKIRQSKDRISDELERLNTAAKNYITTKFGNKATALKNAFVNELNSTNLSEENMENIKQRADEAFNKVVEVDSLIKEILNSEKQKEFNDALNNIGNMSDLEPLKKRIIEFKGSAKREKQQKEDIDRIKAETI